MLDNLKAQVLDKNLPTDEQALAALVQAKTSGLYPVQHIGGALNKQLQTGGYMPFFVQRYPRTLQWLRQPENLEWLKADLERVLEHLENMSVWLNSQQ